MPPAYAVRGGAQAARAAEEDAPSQDHRGPSGLINRQKHPDNLEFLPSALDSDRFLTPNEQFYVRTHFEVPELDATTWRLKVEGEVDRTFELGHDELRRMPSQTATVLPECSGNRRVFLEPPQARIRRELGGVSTAQCTGVPLAAVMERQILPIEVEARRPRGRHRSHKL